jgi:hypothetical protein
MYNNPNEQPQPYNQSPYISPYEQQYSQQTTPPPPVYPQTQYGAPPVYPQQPVYIPVPVLQPAKSGKTVWIVLGVLGGVFLLIISACGASVYFAAQSARSFSNNLHATVVADETAPQDQAQSYYLAISVQDYSGAYDYLASNMTQKDGTKLTQTAFTQQAEALDTSEGQVTDYVSTADPNDASKVTVQVTRSGGTDAAKTYTVHLTFTQGSYQWSISSFDTI